MPDALRVCFVIADESCISFLPRAQVPRQPTRSSASAPLASAPT